MDNSLHSPRPFAHECPYCDVMATMQPRMLALDWGIYFCVNCEEEVLFKKAWVPGKGKRKSTRTLELVDYYPKKIPKFHKAIPKFIIQDLTEAHLCFDSRAWKGSVVLARRALQSACIDKGAKKDTLQNQINDLASKNVIPPQLANLAHKIRLFGNFGAHPSDDLLEKIVKRDAQEVLGFADDFLSQAYVLPYRLSQADKRISAIKTLSKKKKTKP